MMSSLPQREAFRDRLKPYVPRPLWVGARRTVSYMKRLSGWVAVLREIRGRSPSDRAILNRSARKSVLNAMRNLDNWQDPILLADARVKVHGIGEFDLRAFSDDLFHVLPSREPRIVELMHRTLRPGDTFVDAGSNIGFYAILASRLVGPTGKVVAIEMMPDTAERLRLHCRLNKASNVEIVEVALSDRKDGEVIATVTEGKFGQASIARADKAGPLRKVSVQCGTLDDIMAGVAGPIALLKMDLEGAELNACRGARAVLKRTETVVYEQSGAATDVDDLLESAGFRLAQLDGRNRVASKAAGKGGGPFAPLRRPVSVN